MLIPTNPSAALISGVKIAVGHSHLVTVVDPNDCGDVGVVGISIPAGSCVIYGPDDQVSDVLIPYLGGTAVTIIFNEPEINPPVCSQTWISFQ